MKLKRIMAIVLCFAMVLSTMSFSVFAEDAAVIVSDYNELVAALADVETEKTIQLADDITIDTSITIPDGITIDLNDKILYVNVENSYYNNATIINGDIVLGKDDVHVCDGYFLVNVGKTLVLNDVKVSSADGGIKGYAVFHLKTGANLDLIDSTLNISDNEYAAGYIVYAGESTATVDITGTKVTGTKVNGIVHATTVIDNSTFTIDAVEHGINRSAATINDSTVTISGGTGRGITAQHGDLVISGNSVVNISDMGEATIELRNDNNLTVEESATVTVDVAVNNTTSGTISGKVTVEGTTDTPGGDDSDVEEDIILINTAEDLIALRDAVNNGDNYAGKYVKLNADIDLSSVDNWTPIGDTTYNSSYAPVDPSVVFSGTFDGNDKVISNLKIEKTLGEGPDADANVGLFGIIGEGALIKDLTITNVDINTDGRNVGTLAGVAYKATLDNITVNGDIKISGGNNTCGVCAMTRYYDVSATNITVSGEEGSYINGNNIVAGMFAEIAPNGSNQTFENLSVENVAINGVGGVGGIVGLLTNGTISTVSVKDVELVGRTDYQGNAMGRIRLGAVAGLIGGTTATISNVDVENVTAKNRDGDDVVLPVIGANYDAASNATEAKIGDTYYATLAKAFAAAVEGDTVTLLCNIENVIEIPDGVTLETNGYRFGDSLTGMGTKEDPYLINNIDDLVWFRNDVNAGNTYEGKYVKLITDIDLEGYEEMNVNYQGNNVSASTFRPIGDYSCNKASFKGIFDGGNNTISNLYISGWDINYHWDNYGPAGLFGTVENAIIKNLTVEGFEIQVEGGDVAAIAGHAKGNCTFENITVTDSKIATYNNGCAGIVAWSEAGNYTFKGIEVTDSVVLAGLWGSFDSSIGGVLAQANADATYLFEDIDVACRLDIYNDVTAAYKYHLYRMCGMLIGRGAKFMDGNEVDLNASNITCKNVNITIGEWANYTYINTSGNTWKRVEPGYTYGGVDVSQYPDATIDQKPMTSIVGGGQYGYSGTTAEEFAAQGFDETEIKVVDFAKIARSNVAKIGDNYFASIQSAIDAAENGDTVTLLSNVDIANETINTLGGKYNTYYKVTGKSITVDLNGKTISGEYNNDSMLVGVFSTEENGNLTLTGNGKIDITATKTVYSLLVNYDSTSTLTVEDGEYTVDKVSSSLVYSDKGSVEGLYGNTISGVTINGGTFTLGNIDNVNGPWIFNVGGSGDSYVSVNGGTFNFNIAHQKWADEVVVSKNCYVSDNGDGTWTVTDGAQVTLNDTVLSGPYALRMDFGYPTFADAAAVAETDDVITLISNATGEASFDDIRNLTVDLNGYTLNGAILPSKGDITVKNGSIVNENSDVSAIELNEGKLSLENVNISSARHGVRIDGAVESVIDGGKYTLTATSGTRHAVNVSGAANVTIKNGTFVGPKGTTMDSGSAVCVQTGANVTIEGGNFSGGKNATLGVSGTMSITGGTFDQDPSQYVAVGYAAKANDDGIYSIVSIKPDAYTVEARASKTDVRYNNDNTADSFTVKYVVTGGNVIGAMAQFEYDTTLFKCDEDPNATGRIRMNSNNLSTDADGETVLKELHFTVIKDVEVDTTYTFTPKYVQVVSDYDAAGSGAQDGYVENVVGADVTIIAQYDVTLDTEGAIAGNTYVDKNTDYTGTINDFDENKIYTITYTMGSEEYSIEVEDETFVIETVTGDIVFTGVKSELNFELILVADAVSEYTLVLVKDGVSAGYTYNGEEMFAVERYVGLTEVADESVFEAEEGVSIKNATSVRAILIKGAVTLDEARNAIAASADTSDTLDISYDVNRNGAFYFNDAMTAHGCYKDQYTLYENMAKLNWYLSSDVNTDFVVDTDDYDDTVEAFWATLDK